MQMSLLIKDKRRNELKTPNARAEAFLHRMLFKVANEASAALFISRLFAVWVLQRPSPPRLRSPASPSPAPAPVRWLHHLPLAGGPRNPPGTA